uniref:Uncharacterized protein n=1 Tax=Electrophorus electricus TaxID=8005 RepID=A0A4W4EXD2_ELEEL
IPFTRTWANFTFVFDGGRPSSYFLFLWTGFRFPPVLRRLCQLSLEIPCWKECKSVHTFEDTGPILPCTLAT